MPFGVPPSGPQADAVSQYCDAATSDLYGVVQSVVEPLSQQIESIESAVQSVVSIISKTVNSTARTIDRQTQSEIESLQQTIEYMVQQTQSYTSELQQHVISSQAGPTYAQIMSGGPPSQSVSQTQSQSVPVRLTANSSPTSSSTNISYETIYEQAAKKTWSVSASEGVDGGTATARSTAASYLAGVGAGDGPTAASAATAQAVIALAVQSGMSPSEAASAVAGALVQSMIEGGVSPAQAASISASATAGACQSEAGALVNPPIPETYLASGPGGPVATSTPTEPPPAVYGTSPLGTTYKQYLKLRDKAGESPSSNLTPRELQWMAEYYDYMQDVNRARYKFDLPAAVAPKPEAPQPDFIPPLPPVTHTKLPCPQAPSHNGRGALVGSEEWCVGLGDTLAWLEKLGVELSNWINSVVEPAKWDAAIAKLEIKDAGGNVGRIIWNTAIDLIRWAARFLGNGILVWRDAISCAMYMTRSLTPVQHPEAYIAIISVRNLIHWVSGTKIGSQSYLGLTVNTTLRLPQLEAWLDRLLEYLCCIEIPSVPEIADTYTVGLIEQPQYECLMRLNGQDPRLYEPFIRARSDRLTAPEAIQYGRRNNLTADQIVQLLRRAGYSDETQAKQALYLYDELPSVSDHLHWLQKNVYNKDYVDRYGLLEGFEERFWSAFGQQLYAQGFTKERAALDYAAHWIMPAPEQMREMVYRLRKGKDGVSHPFTPEDFGNILAEQDYNPRAVAWFKETLYKVPALSYLRDMHRMGLLTDAQMQSYHADLGYTDDDSKRFTQVDAYRRQRMRASQGSGWSPAAMRKAVAVGQLARPDVAPRMAAMGFSGDDTDDLLSRAQSDLAYRVLARAISTQLTQSISQVRGAIAVGVMDADAATGALTALGMPADKASGIVRLQVAQAQVARVKSAVGRVHHGYITGEVDDEYAAGALTTLGIVTSVIADYLSTWQIELSSGRRRLSKADVMKMYEGGDIDEQETRARLHNLKYDDADIELLVGKSNHKIGEAKDEEGAAKARRADNRAAIMGEKVEP